MKNKLDNNTAIYYSKYGFKAQALVGAKIIYEGRIDECSKDLLVGVHISTGYKYIRIWE